MSTGSVIEPHRRKPTEPELGFTLIELLIVIVVLGILAAVTVFALSGVTAQSAATACNADAQNVDTAVAAYNAQTGGTPVVTSALLTAAPTPYLQSWPSSPYYAISIVGGAVMVAAPSTATPTAYLTANQCANAGAPVSPGIAAPAEVTGTCVSPAEKVVTVSWDAVAGATSYTVYDSVTSSSTGYVVIASTVAGLSWTSGSLGYSTRWFEVTAHTGNLTSAYSAPSAPRSITNGPGCL
jgi:prepilin-type N-terminal cleavage/methylation domain-containing protein